MLQWLINFFLFASFLFGQNITYTGLDLIKYYESFRGKAYYDVVGVLTIGYGSTGNDVIKGMIINREYAEKLLRKDVTRFESHIKRSIYRIILWNEFDALTSFTFNVGYRIKGQLQIFVNNGNINGVVSKLMLYNKAKVNGIYIILKGLTRRRTSETILYKDAVLKF